ncbi:uncharacterized protein LOC128156205 [Crassostrea angulata]|uniref:uncharacterized protein LOC128156205 n=1 Tax=Magallana angulata TaxID=2784310 RepID=UPI0005C3CB6B|nr:uncharacterized protein LOC128156205 [Crassostrea angulata]|eukprot:XP_011427209.1 PREDICTED: uncharacterized protein LOC105328138 [Crassostrea gigas]
MTEQYPKMNVVQIITWLMGYVKFVLQDSLVAIVQFGVLSRPMDYFVVTIATAAHLNATTFMDVGTMNQQNQQHRQPT